MRAAGCREAPTPSRADQVGRHEVSGRGSVAGAPRARSSPRRPRCPSCRCTACAPRHPGGVRLAVIIGGRRLAKRGTPGEAGASTSPCWAVPFGLVGGRLYHVITDYEPYFSEGGTGWRPLHLGGRPGHLGRDRARCGRCLDRLPPPRRPLARLADALAPGIAVAQALGRWGNWFNHGALRHAAPTCPGRLTIHRWDQSPARRWVRAATRSSSGPSTRPSSTSPVVPRPGAAAGPRRPAD